MTAPDIVVILLAAVCLAFATAVVLLVMSAIKDDR